MNRLITHEICCLKKTKKVNYLAVLSTNDKIYICIFSIMMRYYKSHILDRHQHKRASDNYFDSAIQLTQLLGIKPTTILNF